MGSQDLTESSMMKAVLVLSFFVAQSLGLTNQECNPPLPSECAEGDISCDMGADAGGCWMGDYCMAEGSVCPTVCYPPPPSECATTDITCDMGTHDGCWMGDYCMPEGSECPPSCNTPAPTQCQDGEVMCDMAVDTDGCWMGDYCMEMGSVCPE